jgi:hypothetical protein
VIPVLFRPAASAAILLCLGIATATAQNAAPATDGNGAPADQVTQSTPATQPESLQKDAIRVPALGTTSAVSGQAAANGAAQKQVKVAAPKPKKRARVARHVYEDDDDEVVYAQPHYAPRYYYAPRPYYRFGHGIGPGFVYGW